MKRFEIWLAALPFIDNSRVTHGIRPVVIMSNDKANAYSPVVTVIPLTSKTKKPLPTHVVLESPGLRCTSRALCENVLALDKTRLIKPLGCVYDSYERQSLLDALCIQLGLAA